MMIQGTVPRLFPGIAVSALLAGAASALVAAFGWHSVSPLLLAVLLGMALRAVVGARESLRPGVAFTVRPLLRGAVVLLGAQVTAAQVGTLGVAGLAVVAASLAASLWFTGRLGRALGVEPGLARLIGAGTSICGASAVLAVNSVTRAEEEDVAYAIACVTLCGTLSMLAYPLLAEALALNPHVFGLWAGASIHEVGQAVATAFQDGQEAGEIGTLAKLWRVMLLAPVVVTLGATLARRGGRGADGGPAPLPWFVAGFLGLIALNSAGLLPEAARHWAGQAAPFLLAMALGAMGLDADPSKLLARGPRPLLLGLGATLFLASFSLIGILCFA
ncbi:putative integral membrane protein (TIGR00698 family) [Azospirillum agricola]|uniref:YeiH family protein n=1 Tax=Azospirillum agricola TaxID=1720247 RepID=UPI001AE3F57D|nr:putative sulfate exporter family transporter [Azospirillum agricola]MBP2229160.1 putative integral membrane protein (TIGR00698 family) [Azospirillum agricola]